MSYDFYIVPEGAPEDFWMEPHALPAPSGFTAEQVAGEVTGTATLGGGFCGNYTSNIWRMIGWAAWLSIPKATEEWPALAASYVPRGFGALDGMPCYEAAKWLRWWLEAMVEPRNRKEFDGLAPDNGWGDFDGCRMYIAQALSWCEMNPQHRFKVSA